MRNGEEIDIAEFRNVVGRAGRAYVDVEGLVLLPMFDKLAKRRAAWNAMIASAKGKEMESGLLRLIRTLLKRMVAKHNPKSVEDMVAYLAGNAAWDFPVLVGEHTEVAQLERSSWAGYLTTLDTAILSMLGEREVADEDIEATLDEVLTSSLWSRRLLSRKESWRQMLKAGLVARARYIWSRTSATQRHGYFLAGVGLGTGQALDAHATDLNQLLATANGAILNGHSDVAIAAITTFAELAFSIDPFAPDDLPANWRDILSAWLKGETIAKLAMGQEAEVLQFVEQALVYRLPWAMEAVRVRALANSDILESGIMMGDLELGLAVVAVETGTLNRSAAILMHAGFNSRLGAIRAVEETGADFTNMGELRRWLRSEDVADAALDRDWPTAQSHGLWLQFIESLAPARHRTWSKREETLGAQWDNVHAEAGTPVRLYDEDGLTLVLKADFTRLGHLQSPINPQRIGLVQAMVADDEDYLDITYLGPNDLKQRRGESVAE